MVLGVTQLAIVNGDHPSAVYLEGSVTGESVSWLKKLHLEDKLQETAKNAMIQEYKILTSLTVSCLQGCDEAWLNFQYFHLTQ